MGLLLSYQLIAKVYNLLELTYFRNKDTSPRKAVCEFIQYKDVRVLDVCTGTAANAIAIAKINSDAKVIGIDLSKDMLKIAAKKVAKNNLDNVKLYKMDATKTKFKNETFDVVLISLVLHEINKELAKQILLEAKRVLKKEGQIIVVEWEQPQKFIKKFMFLPILRIEPKGFKEFLKLDFKNYFNQYGLYIKDVKHCDYTTVIKLSPIR